MTMKKGKLNSKVIKAASKKEFPRKKVTVKIEGTEYDIMVDQKFATSKIQAMVQEGLEKFKQFEELEPATQIGYFTFLLIKHFTDMDLRECKKFEDDIYMMNSLLDLGIYDAVTPELPSNEILKVNKFMLDIQDKMKNMTEDEKEELKSAISNVIPKEDTEKVELVN